jgi:hypothetical protein
VDYKGGGSSKLVHQEFSSHRGAFKFGFEARAEYAAGSFTPYVNVDGYEIMAATPKMEFQVGCGTSVGSVSIDAHLSVPVTFADSYSFAFSIPVSFELKM